MVYDLIIVGSGPAGLSASVYASRYRLNHIVIGAVPGGLMADAHKICNFPSEEEISGFDLMMKMKIHAEKLGAEIIGDQVTEINRTADKFILQTASGQTYEAKVILLATGTIHRHLNLPNEHKFLGHGLSYCATCDAMFFKNKTVAVVGSGNSATTAALYLAEVATKVYQIVRGADLKGEVVWQDQAKTNPKIEVIFNAQVVELLGENKLSGIKLDGVSGQNELAVDGLFIEIGSTPDTALFDNLKATLDEKNYVVVKADQSTNVIGVYAAGDITTGSNNLRQVITACSEGAIAASSIFQYLQSLK